MTGHNINYLWAAIYSFALAVAVHWSAGSVHLCRAENPNGQDAESVFKQFCVDCHDSSTAEGNFVLDLEHLDWRDPNAIAQLETVQVMVEKQIMPPADADQPDPRQRQMALDWLDHSLVQNSPIGGTPLRRLSRREYARTISAIFGLVDFELPDSFPPDNELHGFDNQGEALVVAASHLEAFSEVATHVADQFFPPQRELPKTKTFRIPADELVISYSSACLIDGAMRLASSGSNEVRNATWPTKFEAPVSGIYEVQITAVSFDPREDQQHIPELRIESTLATGKNAPNRKDLAIHPGGVESGVKQTFRFKIGIDRGASIRASYWNGPYNYEDKAAYPKFLESLFVTEPQLAAAWEKIGDPARGGNGWERLKQVMETDGLETAAYQPGSEAVTGLAKRVAKNAVKSGETLVYKFFEEGPYIGIEQIEIIGPIDTYADRDQQRMERQRVAFLGDFKAESDTTSLRPFMERFLTQAFRRPATDSEVEGYVNLVDRERQSSGSLDRGMHLAIRTALISPAFLYRSLGPGELSQYELASRLSYFLTSGPPDAALLQLAASGKLNQSKTLRKQVQRLLRSNKTFATDFTQQWLGLEAVDRLMPDSRLIRKFTSAHRKAMKDEVTLTFRHVLENNQSVKQLIAPDFVFTDENVGWDIYELAYFKPQKKTKKQTVTKGMQLVEVDPGGRMGGLLAMPAIMMATANGVDTQPVLRGVWVLENIMGSPPPDPPNAVPALTPDTAGATTPKERLAAHMAEESCAACHREIDPLGFVLENFDPIGRWRENYPKSIDQDGSSKLVAGAAVDATGMLPGGQKLSDVTDLKRWLAEHPEPFVRCLGEKLLTYATGRKLNYRERSMVADIVTSAQANDYRFADLIVELVDSEVFRTK